VDKIGSEGPFLGPATYLAGIELITDALTAFLFAISTVITTVSAASAQTIIDRSKNYVEPLLEQIEQNTGHLNALFTASFELIKLPIEFGWYSANFPNTSTPRATGFLNIDRIPITGGDVVQIFYNTRYLFRLYNSAHTLIFTTEGTIVPLDNTEVVKAFPMLGISHRVSIHFDSPSIGYPNQATFNLTRTT